MSTHDAGTTDDSSDNDGISNKPTFTVAQAEEIAAQYFGLFGTAHVLSGERDQNFRIDAPGGRFVLKIANPRVDRARLEFENQAIRIAEAISDFDSPSLVKSVDNQLIASVCDVDGQSWQVRCLTFVPGIPMANFQRHAPELLAEIGRVLGLLDTGLEQLNQTSATKTFFKWDLSRGPDIVRSTIPLIDDLVRRGYLQQVIARYGQVADRIGSLPQSVIHNDANDYNWIINSDDQSNIATIGLIDFGDAIFSTTVNDLAICCAYMMLGKQDAVAAAAAVVGGYHQSRELNDTELSVLFPLIGMRLAQSVCIAFEQKQLRPDDEYLAVSENPAWDLLENLHRQNRDDVRNRFLDQCARQKIGHGIHSLGDDEILQLRARFLSPSLSIAYAQPLRIVRGKAQYLYDDTGTTYLDCVNNVCHVGHCHPHVVRAITQQVEVLNTNTRYLHPNIVRLAERISRTLPDPLEVCFFVNSGSEANDLALRLAQAFTGNRDFLVVDHAYHGHTSSLIDISPYKFNRAGGTGKPDHVHILPMPDGFRGEFHYEQQDFAKKYIAQALELIDRHEKDGRKFAAFIGESILSCGGQVPLSDGYLAEIYNKVRQLGGVCIADEVQVGFGRVGSHFWGFQLQGVVPDIVTMGKPFGNGHPLAAVVTTREIGDAFNTGMEYFNTFGGNPVSCAAGLAVLDVIEKENLQKHAHETGKWILQQWRELKDRHAPKIGDVRGHGLFLGMEFVDNLGSRNPDAKLANRVKNEMKHRRILLSTDGPDDNVIKFKPPMVFDRANAERLVSALNVVLSLR